jgi:hypothetical protein
VLADGGRRLIYHRLAAADALGKRLVARLEVVSSNRLTVVLDDATAQYPVRIDPTFSDANCISLGGIPGANGLVKAVAVDSAGNLYIGGQFTIVGNALAANIAQWDGSTWSALGSGMNSYVFALAVSGNHLFAGGEFTTAGNTGSACVAEAILGDGSGNTPPVIITTNSGFGFSNGLSQFGFDVSGAAGQTLVIQASTNLLDWAPLQTNLLDSALWYFSDTSAGNFPRRFYRAQLLP